MMWINNPDLVRELHNERVRQSSSCTGTPGLRLMRMEGPGRGEWRRLQNGD